MVTNHRHSTITGKADGEERRGVRREEGREHDKGYAMVFGDNVRARRAARALPRTPITRGRRGKRREEENKATRPHTLTRPPHAPPFNTATEQTEKGAPTFTREGCLYQTGGSASRHPPFTHHATPPSTTAPPTTTTRGEWTEDTPPHEHHRHTLTTHTPHTGNGTVHDMTAVLASTAMG